MSANFEAATGLLAQLDLLRIAHRDAVTHLQLARPAKRNAINDALIAQLQTAFVNLPPQTRAVRSGAKRIHHHNNTSPVSMDGGPSVLTIIARSGLWKPSACGYLQSSEAVEGNRPHRDPNPPKAFPRLSGRRGNPTYFTPQIFL